MAVSVVLLVVAMFIYRGFREQLANGPGYRTDHLLMMSFDPSLVRYSEEQSQQFFEQVAERARAVAGVSDRDDDDVDSDVERFDRLRCRSRPKASSSRRARTTRRTLAARVDEHYFDTMGLPLLQGPRLQPARRRRRRRAWPSSTSSSPSTTGRIRIRSASASV